MRHKNKIKHLGRTSAHRGAMLSNMATSLIMHKRIFTTVPKAKALRRYVEPIITRSKEDTTNSRRIVFSMLQNKYAVAELFQTVSPKVSDRPGGYTRIIKTGNRLGDNAAMCFIELVDFNENMLSDSTTKKTRTRRSRRRSGGTATTAAAGATTSSETAVKEVQSVPETETATAVEEQAVIATDTTETPVEEAPTASAESVVDEPKEEKEGSSEKEA